MGTRKGCFAWTDEDLERLRTLHASAMPFREIAQALGCTRNAAIGKAHRLGLFKLEKAAVTPEPEPEPVEPEPVPEPEPPRPVIALRPGEPEPLYIPLHKLTRTTCRWPHGTWPPYTFCGHQTHGSSWCPYHAQLARPGGKTAA